MGLSYSTAVVWDHRQEGVLALLVLQKRVLQEEEAAEKALHSTKSGPTSTERGSTSTQADLEGLVLCVFLLGSLSGAACNRRELQPIFL
jgi:hypothetical protein